MFEISSPSNPFSLCEELANLVKRADADDFVVYLALLPEDERKKEIKDSMRLLEYLQEIVDRYWVAHRKAIYKKQNEEFWRWN